MDPVTALRQIAYYKDRDRQDPRRVMAYRNAADILEGLDEAARERHGQANSWQSIPGIGPKTAKVIAQAWAGREPDQLIELRADATISAGERFAPHCAGIFICIRTGRTGRRRSRR